MTIENGTSRTASFNEVAKWLRDNGYTVTKSTGRKIVFSENPVKQYVTKKAREGKLCYKHMCLSAKNKFTLDYPNKTSHRQYVWYSFYGNGIRGGVVKLLNTSRFHPVMENRLFCDNADCVDKIQRCPVVFRLPLDLDELKRVLDYIRTEEFKEWSMGLVFPVPYPKPNIIPFEVDSRYFD